jgi:hypothetical protein
MRQRDEESGYGMVLAAAIVVGALVAGVHFGLPLALRTGLPWLAARYHVELSLGAASADLTTARIDLHGVHIGGEEPGLRVAHAVLHIDTQALPKLRLRFSRLHLEEGELAFVSLAEGGWGIRGLNAAVLKALPGLLAGPVEVRNVRIAGLGTAFPPVLLTHLEVGGEGGDGSRRLRAEARLGAAGMSFVGTLGSRRAEVRLDGELQIAGVDLAGLAAVSEEADGVRLGGILDARVGLQLRLTEGLPELDFRGVASVVDAQADGPWGRARAGPLRWEGDLRVGAGADLPGGGSLRGTWRAREFRLVAPALEPAGTAQVELQEAVWVGRADWAGPDTLRLQGDLEASRGTWLHAHGARLDLEEPALLGVDYQAGGARLLGRARAHRLHGLNAAALAGLPREFTGEQVEVSRVRLLEGGDVEVQGLTAHSVRGALAGGGELTLATLELSGLGRTAGGVGARELTLHGLELTGTSTPLRLQRALFAPLAIAAGSAHVHAGEIRASGLEVVLRRGPVGGWEGLAGWLKPSASPGLSSDSVSVDGNSRLDLVDAGVSPALELGFPGLGVRASGRGGPVAGGSFRIEGGDAQSGHFRITGRAGAGAGEWLLEGAAEDLPVPALRGHARRLLAVDPVAGRLSGAATLQHRSGHWGGTLEVVLRGLELEDESTGRAVEPPAGALHLLQSSSGVVRLSVPLSPPASTLEELGFSLEAALRGAVLDLYRPLGVSELSVDRLLEGRGVRVRRIVHAAGESALDPGARAFLERLAETIRDKPRVSVRLCPVPVAGDMDKGAEILAETRAVLMAQGLESTRIAACGDSPVPGAEPGLDLVLQGSP